MEVKIIEYKNKKIVYVDYRGVKSEEEILENIRQGAKMHKEAPEKLNTLVNCEGVNMFTEKAVKEVKNIFKDTEHKTALVGVTGVLKTIEQGVEIFASLRHVKLFDTEEAAKEWLVS